MIEQMGLFDAAAGEVAKEEAITRVAANASRAWLEAAWEALEVAMIRLAANRLSDLTTDDVWGVLADRDAPDPRDPRAMGPVMRRAVRDGLLRPTSTFRPSSMPQNHRRPVRVYEVVRNG